MKLKKWTALALSATLATCMLTGCPWDEDDAASSDLPASSSRPSHDGGSDEDDTGSTGGSTGGELTDQLTVTLNFAESFNVYTMTASSDVQEGSNIASFSSSDGDLSWENPAWKIQTTRLVQALSRLSRANGGEYTGTFYALLPNNPTDEQEIVTIVYNDGTSEREYKETLTMNGTSASVQIDLTDKNKNEGTLIEN